MDIKHSANPIIGQVFFLVALIILTYVIFFQLSFFTSCFLGSVTLYVAFRPLMNYFVKKRKWKPWVVSLLLLLLIVFLIALLGALIALLIASEIKMLDTSSLISNLTDLSISINTYTGYDLIPVDIINSAKDLIMGAKDTVLNIAGRLANTTYSFMVNFFMMLTILYFMFAHGEEMEQSLSHYSPIKGKSLQLLKAEVHNMIMSNAVGIPVILIAQSVVSGFGYWLFGIQDYIFWGVLTGLFGIAPVVGSTVIWLPLAIYLMSVHHIGLGIALGLYGAFVVANADNVCRLVVMKKMADVHPLITIFGAILGVPLFGFWGIIFGPLMLSGLGILYKIYINEYGINS